MLAKFQRIQEKSPPKRHDQVYEHRPGTAPLLISQALYSYCWYQIGHLLHGGIALRGFLKLVIISADRTPRINQSKLRKLQPRLDKTIESVRVGQGL